MRPLLVAAAASAACAGPALAVVTILPDRSGEAFYALVGARARSTLLQGMMARVLRGQVERAARDTAAVYLGWIRGSLMMPAP